MKQNWQSSAAINQEGKYNVSLYCKGAGIPKYGDPATMVRFLDERAPEVPLILEAAERRFTSLTSEMIPEGQ